MPPALLLPVAYLLGTVPSAVLVARARGVDITKVGSGNPGASNVTRVLGWKAGTVVFLLDAGKGAAAAGLGLWAGDRPWGYVLAAAAVLGHTFPVSRRGHGGKGVATVAGAMLVLHPLPAVALMPVWWLVRRFTHKAAVASLVVTVALPAGAALDGAPPWELVAIVALGALVFVRHLPNLRRLVRGAEPDADR